MKKILFCLLILLLCSCNNNINVNETEIIENDIEPIYHTFSDVNDLEYGDILLFGKYEQDNDLSESEDIEWVVMDNNGEELILISKYGLDHVTYENSNEWLKEFLNSFNEDEIKYVIKASMFTYYEAENYFDNDVDRICLASKYAINNGVHVYENNDNCWYWLLTEDLKTGPHNVRTDGRIKFIDAKVDDVGYAIRPVLYISTTPFTSTKSIVSENDAIIEILDKSMNTYVSANKKSKISDKVYKGQQFKCINYYETPGYKWYQIDEGKWIGDGNDTRVKLVSGKLVNTLDVDTSIINDQETNKQEEFINSINNLEKHHMSKFKMHADNYKANDFTKIQEYLNLHDYQIDEIEFISFDCDFNYPYDTNKYIHMHIDDQNLKISLQANVWGDISPSYFLLDTLTNLYIRDINSKEIRISDIEKELIDLLCEIESYSFSPCNNYEEVNTVLKPIIEIANNLYPDYELNFRWQD